MKCVGYVLCLVTAASCMRLASSQDRKPSSDASLDSALLNADLPTFGGKQFWTDEFVYFEWRIQRNVITGHYRLLDDKNLRRAWGTSQQCREVFDQLRQEAELPPFAPRAVIVLHGLVRSRESMEGLCEYLREHSDFTVLNVSYASARGKVSDHAAALARVIEGLEGVGEVNFVAHSLGNLVIRHYFGDRANASGESRGQARCGRIVMLAPPNRGAEMALRFRSNRLFQTVWGESGRELAEDWPSLEKRLAVPPCPFGVIAGGKGDGEGRNPLLPGDDDFVVSVDETRLKGASDFSIVPSLHGTIMADRQVQEQTLRFLQFGHFVSDEARQPISDDVANP